MQVKVKRISDAFNDIELPSYKTAGSAGADLRAAIYHKIELMPGERAVIPTNISVEVPAGYELQIRSRSGMAANNGVFVLNSPGTIDSDYRGEIKVILTNTDPLRWIIIKRGDRIAQMVLNKVYRANFAEVAELGDTERSAGGFGSTGIE